MSIVKYYFHHTGKYLGSVLQPSHICKNPQTRCFLYNVDVRASCLCLDESRLCRYVRLPGECNSNTTSHLEFFIRMPHKDFFLQIYKTLVCKSFHQQSNLNGMFAQLSF